MNNEVRKRWTKEEDDRLFRQIKAFPGNLNKCFLIVSEEIGRTPAACASHWYSSLSKKAEVAFFTASTRSVSKNRKNGKGVESNPSIWRRLLRVIQTIIH